MDNGDYFGWSTVRLGDLDGDGIGDLAVGARRDDDGGTDLGALWVLFLNVDGSVKAHQKISSTTGGFTGSLDAVDYFATATAPLGDLDGDGVPDVAVSAHGDDDGGTDRGAVWILFLNSDGTVKSHQKISELQGGIPGILDNSDYFGIRMASLGDLDGDGVQDLAVCAQGDDDGGADRGAVWVLFLNVDGTVKSYQKISASQGGFTGNLDQGDTFGVGLTTLADLDGDGIQDLAAGAYRDDDGGTDRGAVWILFLNADGTVKSHRKISYLSGGFSGHLDNDDRFGLGLTALGDLDGDGVEDLAVGVEHDDDGGAESGAVWVLFLRSDGSVKWHQKISATSTGSGFTGTIDPGDRFGFSLASLGDLDGDGVQDLAVGATFDDDGGLDRGAVWVLFLERPTPPPEMPAIVGEEHKISDIAGDFTGVLDDTDWFGRCVTSLGDLDGDGVVDMAVGARNDDDGGADRGAVWILFMNSDGTVKTHQKISST